MTDGNAIRDLCVDTVALEAGRMYDGYEGDEDPICRRRKEQ